MYVRFTPAVAKKDGGMVTSRHGLKVGEASIYPLNPYLPNVELRSFGVWQAGSRIVVTSPTGGTNFPHIVGRPLTRTVKDEDGTESVEVSASIAGTKEIDALLDAILAIFKANPAKVFEAGARFELPAPAPITVTGKNAGTDAIKDAIAVAAKSGK